MTRRTIASPASVTGIGVFTGAPATLTISPAEPGTGVRVFRPEWDAPCPATIDSLGTGHPHPAFAQLPDGARCTALAPLGAPSLFTVEHALAALAGLGITDALLTCDGPEIPIDDGSAKAFAGAILDAGVKELDGNAEPLVVTQRLEVERHNAIITFEPAEVTSYEYRLDYGGALPLAQQSATWDADPGSFTTDIAPARTFSFAAEVKLLRGAGLFESFSPRDLLVIDDAGNPIDNAWRFPNEPARHKLLDLIGDLSMVGRPIRARITAECSGHALNQAAANSLAYHFAE